MTILENITLQEDYQLLPTEKDSTQDLPGLNFMEPHH